MELRPIRRVIQSGAAEFNEERGTDDAVCAGRAPAFAFPLAKTFARKAGLIDDRRARRGFGEGAGDGAQRPRNRNF